jgi:type II secretory pathway pseudopilin PulG
MVVSWCGTASYAPRNRPGATLIEVMFITMVVGILVVIIAGPVGAARERAMVAATKNDIRNLEGAIERYIVNELAMPASLDDLDEYEQTPEVMYCRFIPTLGADLRSSTVELAAMHRGAATVVSTIYPVAGGRFTETSLKKATCPNPKKKLVKVAKKKT